MKRRLSPPGKTPINSKTKKINHELHKTGNKIPCGTLARYTVKGMRLRVFA
jgi:hypothetical protein